MVTAIAAEASGGAWMANPDYSAPDVRHFDGSTWTVHSAASTESSPGADDGLPAERIVRIRTLPSGRVGFLSDYDLATMLQSSTFERLGPADGHPAFLEDVAELSDGTLVFGGNSGVTLAP